eukprot:scaffold434392_cov24-Prasinocladus_malaysianus.AAC.1
MVSMAKQGFVEWINRPDKRPVILAEFQQAFNGVDGDLRKRPEVIAELLLRADELRDALWDVCDKRLEENEAEHVAIVKDSFVDDHVQIIAAKIQALMQARRNQLPSAKIWFTGKVEHKMSYERLILYRVQ